jgi:hypothetical protein
LKILLAISILFFAFDSSGQQAKQDTVKTDTLKNKYIPTGVRIGTDIISLVKTRTQDNYNGWEINGDIDFDRYYVALEFGKWGRKLNGDSTSYSNDGRYWRFGVDVNFLKKDPDKNMFFIGARYGRSTFSERMSIIGNDPIWGTLISNYENSDISAHWLELTSGLRVKVLKIFWIGYTGRLKFGLKTGSTGQMLPYDVPGFGRTDKDTTWGFNYYIMLRIPIRKAPPMPLSVKK